MRKERDAAFVPEEQHGGGHRHERLSQLLFEELDGLLRDEVRDPALGVARLAAVELSVDYRSVRARFFTNAEGEEPKAVVTRLQRAFERATPFLRRRLGEALDLKRLPELHFVYDRDAAGELRAARVLERPPELKPGS